MSRIRLCGHRKISHTTVNMIFATIPAVGKLGDCYYFGRGVQQDYSKAAEYFREAADNGDVPAQSHLGICYYTGSGVDQDYKEAFRWCMSAANKGDANAQAIIGECFNNGNGVERDYLEAVNWYIKAAENGSEAANDKLLKIVMTIFGKNIPRK